MPVYDLIGDDMSILSDLGFLSFLAAVSPMISLKLVAFLRGACLRPNASEVYHLVEQVNLVNHRLSWTGTWQGASSAPRTSRRES